MTTDFSDYTDDQDRLLSASGLIRVIRVIRGEPEQRIRTKRVSEPVARFAVFLGVVGLLPRCVTGRSTSRSALIVAT